MIRSLLIISALVAGSAAVHAQATLDAANANPVIGDKYLSYTSSTHDGSLTGGAAVSWNFSTFSIVSTDTMRFVACDAASFCSQYPGSNIVTKQNNFYSNWANAGADSLTQTGEPGKPWDDPKVMMRYPFTYNSVVRDSFKYYSGTNMELTRGADTMSGDGYGTLQVLGVTYSNVLRVHHTETRYDSVWAFAGTATRSRIDAYEWYVPGHHLPKVIVAFIDRNGVPDTLINFSVLYMPAGVASIEGTDRALKVYPVPANDRINIGFAAGEDERITVTITDMTGRVVAVVADKVFDKGANSVSCPVSDLAKGVYCLTVAGAQGSVVRKIVVQ